MIKRPIKPKPLKLSDGFPSKTKWNPNKPASAVDNRPPQSMWPHKEGAAVYFIDDRDGQPRSGRVKWFQPAREIDASFCVSVGHPCITISVGDDRSSLVSSCNVFPFTNAGWKKCLLKMAADCDANAEHWLNQESEAAINAAESAKLASRIRQQANKK